MVPRLALPNVMSHRLTNGFKLIHQQTLLHFLLLLHSRDLFTFWVERTARMHHGILYRNTTLTLICGRRSCHLVALEQKFVPLLMEVIYMLLGAVILQISTWTLIVERFDPRSNTWNKLPSMRSRRASASGAAIKKKVFVFGGIQPEGVDAGHACEMYDPDTKVWSAFASQVAPRITSAVSFKGKIYVFVMNYPL